MKETIKCDLNCKILLHIEKYPGPKQRKHRLPHPEYTEGALQMHFDVCENDGYLKHIPNGDYFELTEAGRRALDQFRGEDMPHCQWGAHAIDSSANMAK